MWDQLSSQTIPAKTTIPWGEGELMVKGDMEYPTTLRGLPLHTGWTHPSLQSQTRQPSVNAVTAATPRLAGGSLL